MEAKEKLQKLKTEAEQRATALFEAYHQALGAVEVYGRLIKELEEDEIAEELKRTKGKNEKK